MNNGPRTCLSFCAACAVALPTVSAQVCMQRWQTIGDADITITALVAADIGARATLFAGGGGLRTAQGVRINGIAQWDGTSWTPLGTGLERIIKPPEPGVPYSLVAFEDAQGVGLFAGGAFEVAGGIKVRNLARWDGARWQDVGGGLGGPPLPWGRYSVDALAVFDDGSGSSLYAAGWFAEAGANPALPVNGIARWDGERWSALGEGILPTGQIECMTVWDDGNGSALYVGGRFYSAGGIAVNGIARWNGVEWQSLGPGGPDGCEAVVFTIVPHDDGWGEALFVGGRFSTAGGIPGTRSLAKWRPARGWEPVAPIDPFQSCPNFKRLGVYDDGTTGRSLYVAGSFTAQGGVVKDFARWDGERWWPLGAPLRASYISGITEFEDGTDRWLWYGGFMVDPITRRIVTGIMRYRCRPIPCYADFNGDLAVNVFDFLDFQNAWQARNAGADCDQAGPGAGVFDVFDFLCFQNHFANGCP